MFPPALQAQWPVCTNGTQQTCRCDTAPVLCTIDELDNYVFGMSNYQHPWDGPTPLCPPQTGTVPNNPTWFAFVAWCTSLTLLVQVSGCHPFQGNVNGVQIAIYSSCNPYTPVACNTAASDCNTNDKTLTMNNLIIGNTYYFLIDGCAGAWCDQVTIDVIGTCGEAVIAPWTQNVGGPQTVCIGSSATHNVQDLDGATDYHWYINGMLVSEGNGLLNYTQVWNTAGVFEICVDASNDPCIPESNPPSQNCILVEVVDAEAGNIQAVPTPICPDGTVNINASAFATGTGYQQYIIVTNAAGVIVAVNAGSSMNFSWDACAQFVAYSYNYHNSGGNLPPVVGTHISSLNCNTGCCELDLVPFEFVDNIVPVLLNPPADLALTCYDQLTPMQSLNWTDNCDGTGMVAGMESGVANLCNGGVLTRQWQYTDACGNTASHLQMITIAALPMPAFDNLPPNITVDCSNIPSSAPTLQVMNGGQGACQILASVTPVQNGDANICGGSYSYIWTYTDVCNRTITHTQNVTVLQIPAAMFVDIPADITIECHEIPTSVPGLDYTNGGSGTCAIAGTVSGIAGGSADLCGGVLTHRWEFMDVCGRAISATQRISVNPVAEAVFVDPPTDFTITCAEVPTSFPSLSYTNGLSGACLISGDAMPQVVNNATACGGAITVTWQFTDPCGRSTSHVQTLTVTPAPSPVWINPPNDTTSTCSMLPMSMPDLAYTNGESGVCDISGSVPAVLALMDICQGVMIWEWQYTDPCGNTISHTMTITSDTPPPVIFINPPDDITVACTGVPAIIPDLMYTNNTTGPCSVSGTAQGIQSGSVLLCGGELQRRWMVTDPCGNIFIHQQTITVLPAPDPVFQTLPPDVTVACDAVPTPAPLMWSNGMPQGPCAQVGAAPAEVTGSHDACGGSYTYSWNVTDFCGVMISHSQNITVLPANPPAFVNPPAMNVTLGCIDITEEPPGLDYTNNMSDACAITGTVIAERTGSYDACGGMLVHTWVVESCGNTLSYTQNVIVTPAPDPQWIDPPANDSLGCDDLYLPPGALSYSNNVSGACAIEGTVFPEVIFDNYVYIHTWSFSHPCTGATVTYEQRVVTTPIPDIAIDPVSVQICHGDMFDLSSILVSDAEGQELTLTYHTGTPAMPSNQVSPMITVTADRTYYILATNSAGCRDEIAFEVFVLPIPNAGPDNNTIICQTETVDFETLIAGWADPGGWWEDVDNSGVDLFNINSVRFNIIEPGVYRFWYIVQINTCPPDTAVVTINLNGPPDYTIDSVFCTDFNTMYGVAISGTNIVVIASHGNVVQVPGGIVIENIPVDQTLIFDIYEIGVNCFYTVTITPPNCDCPSVPPPQSLGNVVICAGDPIPALAVTVGAGLTAHWYATPSGGVPLASNTTTYTPMVSAPGIYTYYIESEDLDFPGCYSNTRTPVTLEIRALPVVNDLSLQFCDTLDTGTLPINLNDWRTQINGNPMNTVTYHATLSDAEDGLNALSMPVVLNSGVNIFYARVLNPVGCDAVATISVTLISLPDFSLQIMHESCSGYADGEILIAGIDSMISYTVVLDGTDYTNVFAFTGLAPGSHNLSLTSSATGCTREVMFTITPGAQLMISSPVLACNDNGTDTDPSDDFYTIAVTVSTSGITTGYELFADGVSIGLHTYGMPAVFTLPATSQIVQLVAVDTTLGCSTSITIGPLGTCSSNCDITIDVFSQVCSDNGTPVDPADDFHTITITASAVNGDPGNQYLVLLNGVLTYTFSYGIPESFTLPVSAPAPSIVLQDASDAQCLLNLAINPLTGCSNQCVIPVPDVLYTCSDNGTPEDVTDDYYTIIFTPVVTNPGPSATVIILVDGIVVQSAPAGTEVTVTLPADGLVHNLQITDQDDTTCSAQWSTIILTPCSILCIITLESITSDCNDNGTPLIPGDDFYTITWNATAVFGSASQTYTILLDGTPSGTGSYGTTETLTIPADGNSHTITLRDADEVLCILQIPLPPLVHCSNDCILSASINIVTCDNNGTNQTDADDLFYVEVLVTGTNIPSGAWQLIGQPVTGLLGTTSTLGPFPIAGGDVVLVFAAQGSDCMDMLTIPAPVPCSSCDQTIDAGSDVFLDCGSPSAILSVTTSHPGTIRWTDPGGSVSQTPTIVASIPGMYIVTVSFPDGCAFSDTVQVTADPSLPAVWAGPNQTLNCDIREVTLMGQIIIGSGASQFEWTDAGGMVIGNSASVIVSQPGQYFVRIYDPNVDCWSGQDAVEVSDISNDPSAVIFATPDNLLSCVIQSVILSTPGEPDVLYTWIAGGIPYMDPMLQIFEGGTVMLIALDTITRCESIGEITITELSDYPSIQIADPLPITCARTSVLLDASGSIPTVGANYLWTSLAGDTLGFASTLSVSAGGMYILVMTDPVNGCTSSDTVRVTDLSEYPQIVPAQDVLLPCDTESVSLGVTVTSPTTDIQIMWTASGGQIVGGSSGSQVNVLGAGTYIAQITHQPSQCIVYDTIRVFAITDRPHGINAESSPASCAGVSDGMIVLSGVQGGTPPYVFYVNGIQTTQSVLSGLSPGTYLIQIEDAAGCTFDTTVSVEQGDEVVVDLETHINIRIGESIILMAGVNIPEEEISSVMWSPSTYLSCDTCLTTTARPTEDIAYTLHIEDIFGCIGEATVLIRVVDAVSIFIPNAITPSNGDQINDYFTVFSNKPDTEILSMRIFDRWGELMFEKTNFPPNIPQEGWDGTFRGRTLNPGVFVYVVEFRTPNGFVEILKGDVTIIR